MSHTALSSGREIYSESSAERVGESIWLLPQVDGSMNNSISGSTFKLIIGQPSRTPFGVSWFLARLEPWQYYAAGAASRSWFVVCLS